MQVPLWVAYQSNTVSPWKLPSILDELISPYDKSGIARSLLNVKQEMTKKEKGEKELECWETWLEIDGIECVLDISKCWVSSCVGLPHQGRLIESRSNICYSGLLTSHLCCISTYRRIGSMSIGVNLIYFVNRCEEMWGAYWNYDCLILRTTFSVFYIAFAAQFVVYQERYISGRVPQVGDDIHRVGCTVRGGILTSVDCRWMRADIGELHYTDWTYYFFFHV